MRIVRDVELGYERTIKDDISSLQAVTEEIIQDYMKLMDKTNDGRIKSTLAKIIPELRGHVEVLRSMSENFRKMLEDIKRHGESLQAFYFDEELSPFRQKDP
jgi:rubrerythrin